MGTMGTLSDQRPLRLQLSSLARDVSALAGVVDFVSPADVSPPLRELSRTFAVIPDWNEKERKGEWSVNLIVCMCMSLGCFI